MENHRIRPVEAFPAQDNLICLRDPFNFSDKMLLVPQDVFFVCTMLDGKNSLLDIQAEYTRRFGEILFTDRFKELIDRLDRCFFLDNQRFYDERKRIVDDFVRSPTRYASHAGATYEAEPEALRKQLDGFFNDREGPGLPELSTDSADLVGIIAPHIDLRRGGLCYAWSYWELARRCDAQTFVILGISHSQTQRRFVLTTKDFETPLGTVKNDRKFTESLRKMCVQDFFVDELIHRSEHSIEFQVLFLQHLFGGKRDIRIVPILCTAFHIDDGTTDPTEMQAEVEGFLNALSQTVRESKRKVCVIAGVDLSHLGRRFGQEVDLSTDFIKMAQKEDNKMLEYVLDQDPPGFLQSILDEKDRRNVCGVPAIYSLLKLLETGSGSTKLLKYDWAAEVPSQSLVTFAGVAFYNE